MRVQWPLPFGNAPDKWYFGALVTLELVSPASRGAEAGGARDSDVRSKDGVELRVNYATSVNQVRQKTQVVVKQNLEAIGFAVELISVDAGIHFDTGPGNDQNIYKFYWDLEMYQSVPTNPTPIPYMEGWYAGPDGSNIAQASNEWTGGNTNRYNNPEYDTLLNQARTETDPELLADLFIQMSDNASIPLCGWAPRSAWSTP